jgi:uncharacterized protein (DUF2236 family)
MTDLIETGQVAVSDQGRAIARSILWPPVRWAPDLLTAPVRSVTIWMLPPALREQFGFSWGPRREGLLRGAAALCRAVIPHVPHALRDLPYARSAERRSQPPLSSRW